MYLTGCGPAEGAGTDWSGQNVSMDEIAVVPGAWAGRQQGQAAGV
jgi:hypothetical protein